jgi:alpha-glucosidase
VSGRPWWRDAVVYQIYPRSFADTTGNGIGDLQGIRGHLDHLVWLGVDALWLSPIYRSPMADAGYDVAEHTDVDPLFGDLDDFDALLADAHARGIRVLLDWVPNHTSDQHPWFLESRRSRDSARREWYVWRDGPPDSPPNNWLEAFGTGPAWTYDEPTGQWYLHLFLPEQPDLNWSEPGVRDAMHDVLRFWLRRGVDGFRADVVHLIGKDPDLPSHPPELVGTSVVASHDVDVTHELLRGIRAVLDEFPGERAMVGEVNLRSPQLVARYYGEADELHLAFNFAPMDGPWDAEFWASAVEETLAAFSPRDAWPTWVLSNHDTPRHRTRYGGCEARARRGRPAAHAAGYAVHLRRRGARARGRRDIARTAGRSRWPRRLSRTDPVDRRGGARVAGRALAALPAAAGGVQRRETARRSSVGPESLSPAARRA